MPSRSLLQISQCVTEDYPDLQLPSGLDVISGILYIPLSLTGQDFIALLRKGEIRRVHWAGRPYKDPNSTDSSLEPRKSFKVGFVGCSLEYVELTDRQNDRYGLNPLQGAVEHGLTSSSTPPLFLH